MKQVDSFTKELVDCFIKVMSRESINAQISIQDNDKYYLSGEIKHLGYEYRLSVRDEARKVSFFVFCENKKLFFQAGFLRKSPQKARKIFLVLSKKMMNRLLYDVIVT